MIVNVKDKGQVNLPDFMIVGAAKCGTTSLYHYLRQHPDIYMPNSKEPDFFTHMGINPYECANPPARGDIIWRFEDYVALFNESGSGQMIGEASVSYLFNHEVSIKNIKAIYGEKSKDIKIIIMLRNPAERVFSHYNFMVKVGKEHLSFQEAIESRVLEERKKRGQSFTAYIDYSMYYHQLKSYMDEFPNLKVYLFDELKDSDRLASEIFEFLGVDKDVRVKTDVKTNPSGVPRNRFLTRLLIKRGPIKMFLKRNIPPSSTLKLIALREWILRGLLRKSKLPEKTRAELTEFFSEDLKKVEKLIGRDLSHWMGSKK
jgi:hypothetical protein